MTHQVLVGTVGDFRAVLRVTITDQRNVSGRLMVNDADDQAVVGSLVSHGGLALQLTDGSLMTGGYDGHSFWGNVMRHQTTVAVFSFSRLVDIQENDGNTAPETLNRVDAVAPQDSAMADVRR